MAASVQSMCQYWKNFDLQELQKELDVTATELANRQDESDASRKRLVEQSRDFKKNTPEDIRKIVAPLLKSFQAEVDALSKRSKSSEAAFLSVYKRIIDVPDPVPCLEVAIQFQKKAQRVQDFEIENKQLRDTLNEYNHEFAEVKNQEVTIKQLREKLKDYEEKLESTAESRAKEKEKELQRQFNDKERQLQESQLGVAKKLGEAEQKIASLQHALDSAQSELFDVRSKYDETTSAKSDELEMVMGDIDRANERAATAEREVETLTRQLAATRQTLSQTDSGQKAPDMEQAIDILKRSSLEVELAAKEKEIAQLVEDVQRLQASINKQREASESQITRLEDQLVAKSKAFETLEEKMRSQEDYEELKRELNILKSVEFQSSEDREEARGKSLEMLLLEKNKVLQSENTQLKVSSKDVTGISSNAVKNTEELPSPDLPRKSSRGRVNSGKSNKVSSNHIRSSPLSNGSHSHMGSPPPQFYGLHGHQEIVTRLNGPKLDQNNSVGLETAIVAKTVRELLSIHNLGQRLFAKHILGLSQGTVSELLSKPKSWDKLTEKGRESYRKMYAWASDERNILALKELSPRKGTQPLVPTVKREDSATEERIAQILNDAKHAMQGKKGKNHSLEQSMQEQQLSPAMMASLYHQEMLKMARVPDSPDSLGSGIQRAPQAHHNGPAHHGVRRSKESRIRSPSVSGRRERESHSGSRHIEEEQNPEEMVARIYRDELAKLAQAAEKAGNIAASTMYQQELARIAQNAQLKHHYPLAESGRESRSAHTRIKTEPRERSCNSSEEDPSDMPQDLSKHSRRSSDDSATGAPSRHSGSAFKLVHPHTRVNGHGTPEPGYSTPVPPDSVSPLQRMQNIANSLMSRNTPPSANHRPLKAVLPPIAQEQFDKYSNVNTEDLVKKVKETLSQYSISQRLFGENVLGLSQGSVSDLLARPKPWHMLTQKGREPFIRMQIFLEDAEAIPKLVATQYRIPPDKLMRAESLPPTPTTDGPLSPPPDSSHTVARQPTTTTPTSQQDPIFEAAVCGHYFGFYTNSIFEIAAMTPDLDTVDLTSKIKDILQFHNLGQKLFGEAVLGLSQGSVSELLSKPKPWSVLSIKGKEPFVRMLLWLNDPYNIEKLKLYQTEAKANRRRKSSVDEQRSCETPIKRPRVFFTEEQKETLRTAYANDPYPNQNTIEALANGLNVGVKTVVNWFHNHRMRAKQVHHTGSSSSNSYDYNPMSVKSEQGEDNSNLSDGMSTPGDTPGLYKQGSSEDNGQWLFPQFETVRPSPSDGQSDDGALRLDLSKYGGVKEEVVGKMEDIMAPSAVVASGQSGVKKRKSSQPKRVYEGTQLERMHCQTENPDTADEGEKSPGSKTEDEELSTINNNNVDYGSPLKRDKSPSQSSSEDSQDESVSLETLRKAAEAPGYWGKNNDVKLGSGNETEQDLKETSDMEED